MNKQLGISFGALSDPIDKQLKSQGFKFDAKKVKDFGVKIDALHHLRFGSYLSDSEASKVTKRIYKAIEKHVLKENKLIVVKLKTNNK